MLARARHRHRHRRPRASQIVEFLFVLPAITLLMVLVFDFGRMTYAHVALHDAAYTAARSGAQVGGAELGDEISRRVFDDTASTAPVLANLSNVSSQVRNGRVCSSNGPDRFVIIDAQAQFDFATPGLFSLFELVADSPNINATGVARCEVVRR